MAEMRTPGVYIVEKNAFPNSVVEVSTAVPAFVGSTEKPGDGVFKPKRIASLAEYVQIFGTGPTPLFDIVEKTDPAAPADFQAPDTDGKPTDYVLVQSSSKTGTGYLLYTALHWFFMNGGGPCYIVPAGNHGQDLDPAAFRDGIDALCREPEPSILVIPEAVRLERSACVDVQQKMLAHCAQMQNRFAILDIWGGDKPRNDPGGDPVARFRNGIGDTSLGYAAAYYPWLNATLVRNVDLSYENVTAVDILQKLLRREQHLPETATAETSPQDETKIRAIADIAKDWGKAEPAPTDEEIQADKALLNRTLRTISPLFNTILETMQEKLNRMPPSAAVAGVYAAVDAGRGVWKAPANVPMLGVAAPMVSISDGEQEDLNLPESGKSVNAIRTFPSQGVLVWGARTLDGNSHDFRYINVRRTMIMLEQSCKLAVQAYRFEPNTAATWVTVRSMLANFLNGVWKRGGLAGATPQEAFGVHCGLSETMTPQDVLEGILRVTMQIAVVRPGEFIEVTFQQQMQTS